jgi:hypothetical protein
MKRHVKYIVVTLSCFAWVNSYAQTETTAKSKMLEQAYHKRSKAALNSFFQEWQKEIPSISDSEFNKLNQIQKEAYKVFKAFYQPTNLEKLGGSEWGNDIYKNVKYLLVQNRVDIYSTNQLYVDAKDSAEQIEWAINNHKIDTAFTFGIDSNEDSENRALIIIHGQSFDSRHPQIVYRQNGLIHLTLFGQHIYQDDFNSNESLTDSILNFRPKIDCEGKNPLYLVRDYEKRLNKFLENHFKQLGTPNIMSPAQAEGESTKRKEFLEQFIKIWYGHWGGYWQLNSYPTASSICFDKTYTKAKVSFEMVYEGGETILRKENGVWKIISSTLTWIE